MHPSEPGPVGPVTVLTSDGVSLHGVHDRGSGVGDGPTFVLCHGFTQHCEDRSVRRIRRALQPDPVLAIDLRGHGRSGGACTLGADEIRDVDAAVGHLRSLGRRRIVTVGTSLGGAAVLRHAGLGEHRPDACVAISAPSRWWIRRTPAMRRVHWLIERPHGRIAGRLLGVRLAPRWRTTPAAPIEMVHRIDPIPLLLVHGTADRYFGPEHARALHGAAGHGELWIVDGAGHGASGSTPALARRIRAWSRGAVPTDARPLATT